MRMKPHTAQDKKLADDECMLRAWHAWHAEELAEALAGPHRQVLEPLVQLLETLDLHSSKALLDYIRAQDWNAIDAQTKLVVLHEINSAMTRLRVRNGMAPIDDALWGERATAFQLIRLIIVPINGKPAAGRLSGQSDVQRRML